MPAAAAKSKPVKDTPRQALCRALLDHRAANAAVYLHEDSLKARLKAIGDKDGSFRENFAELGYVSVSPSKPAQTIGSAPVLQVEAWTSLKPNRQDKLIEDGIVTIEPITKRATYGQVRVKLLNEPDGDD